MKSRILILILITLFLMFLSCFKKNSNGTSEVENITITIYAAAGTRIVTDEICDLFEKKYNYIVKRNYASSGTLARQIANGAESDVYVSANKQWIDFLIEKGYLKNDSVKVVGMNSLVVIVPVDFKGIRPEFKNEFDVFSSIPDKIALGDPAYVPVGQYAKKTLDNFGWYDQINEKGKMILCKDVSSVLHYIEQGECDWGIVYYTEAIQSDKVKIISKIPSYLHDPIVFYVADVKEQKIIGQKLSRMFTEKTGQKIYKEHGFEIP